VLKTNPDQDSLSAAHRQAINTIDKRFEFGSKKERLTVKNYSQLAELFVPARNDELTTNFTDIIKKRAEQKRSQLALNSSASIELPDNFNSGILNARFAVDVSSHAKQKHILPGIKPSRSEQLLKLNRSLPDTASNLDNLLYKKPPALIKPRDKSMDGPLRPRKNLIELNIFRK
jgi:hypothetical protein